MSGVAAKFYLHDGTVFVPWRYSYCTMMENSFRCGRGFEGDIVIFV